MQSISFPGSRVVFGRRRLGAGKDWPLRCPQRFDPQLKKIKENVVEHARLFFYIFNLKSKASHTYCLCYFQEVVIGLTEHSRLYVNNKEVGSFFSFIVIKYLMTGPNGNSEFCFPQDPQYSPRRSRGEHWGQGETKLTLSAGPVIKCFAIPSNSKPEKTGNKTFALRRVAYKFAAVSGSRPDHFRVKSSCFCSLRS